MADVSSPSGSAGFDPRTITRPDRALLVYPATRSSLADVRPFLRRHHTLLAALPVWTLRLVFAPDRRPSEAAWQAVIDHEIGPLLDVAGGAERRVEWRPLGHRYGHLSPLVAGVAWSNVGVEQGEQKGEQARSRSQPPWPVELRQRRRTSRTARQVGSTTNNHWPCVM